MTRVQYIIFGQWRYYHSPTELHLAVHLIGLGCSIPWILGMTAYGIEYPGSAGIVDQFWLGIVCAIFSIGGIVSGCLEALRVFVPLWRAFFALCNVCAVSIMAHEGLSTPLMPTLAGGQAAWEICNIYLVIRSLLDANVLYERRK